MTIPATLRPVVHAALEDVVARRRAGGRAVAVFDYDNTCIRGDIGERFGQFMVDEQLYRYDLEEFWRLTDPADGRDDAQRLAEDVASVAADDPARSALFAAYQAEMTALYTRLTARAGKAAAYAWAVLLHVGLTEAQMFDFSRRCVRAEWARELRTQRLQTDAGESFEVSVGVRRFAEVRAVHDWLRQHGFEVWIVSATNEWTVKIAAQEMFGHDPAFTIGNRVHVRDGKLTAELDGAALFREGKVEAIERYIGVQPSIVFGDSETDLAMMLWAADAAVLMDHGDVSMRRHAAQHGWAVQPHAGLTLEAL